MKNNNKLGFGQPFMKRYRRNERERRRVKCLNNEYEKLKQLIVFMKNKFIYKVAAYFWRQK